MKDYFGNDPRGVSEHTQAQIEVWENAAEDLKTSKHLFLTTINWLCKKHGLEADKESLENMFDYFDDSFHKSITDLESRIGRE